MPTITWPTPKTKTKKPFKPNEWAVLYKYGSSLDTWGVYKTKSEAIQEAKKQCIKTQHTYYIFEMVEAVQFPPNIKPIVVPVCML